MSAVFVYGLGGAVAVMWCASMGAEILTSGGYETPLAVHGLMGTVVGSVFGEAAMRFYGKRRFGSDE